MTGRGKAYASGTAYRAGIDTWNKSYKMVAVDYENVVVPVSKVNTYNPGTNKDYKDLEDAVSDAADEFREVFDWIEVRLEEINEDLNLKNAKLENAIGASAQNSIIDDMIALNRELYDNLLAGADEYYKYSATLLEKVPEEYRNAAQDGTIAIEEFVGEANEETINAIQEYREWVQKGDDATQQAEETLTEISNLAAQAIKNIEDSYDNLLSKNDAKMDQLDAHNAYMDTTTGFESEDIYAAMIKENEEKIKTATEKRNAMQAELDKRVQSGEITVDSQEWYDAVNAISEVDTEIINLKTDNEDFQDSINELHWEKFDLLMKNFQAVSDEAENLLDILSTKDAVDELGNWTDDGITSLGLLAQQMEVAEMQAKKYQEEIDYLNENWETLGYTQEEYIDKLEELKSGQYDAIQSYHDAKDAIVDLNKARVDAIKNGIEKEIDAYEKLIKAKKEELDAEKDLYDFQKGVAKQQKNIADLERQLTALSNDNSASARAKRAQLEADLYEAKAALEETYYDRSISNQQEALDNELENFQNEKDEEIEELEKYLENIELVVADSLSIVQEHAVTIFDTLTSLGEQYGLTITDALIQPWQHGVIAIQEYGTKLNMSLIELASMLGLTVDDFAAKLGMTLPALAESLGMTVDDLTGNLDMTMAQFAGRMGMTIDELAAKFGLTAGELAGKLGMTYQDLTNPFGLSMSATVDALKDLEIEYSNILANIVEESKKAVEEVNKAMQKYQSAEKQEKKQETQQNNNTLAVTNTKKAITIGGKINAGNAKIYSDSYGKGGGKQYYSNDPIYTVLQENNGYVLVRHHKLKSGYTGWFKKSDIKAYAKGTTGIDEDQWALLHELGDELVFAAGPNGKLQYITRGTAVIPHDISENLMELGQLDPSEILRRNTPQIGASPSVVNNAVEINMNIAEVVHIDSVSNETIPDLTKAVRKEMDSYMVKLNNAIKAKVR